MPLSTKEVILIKVTLILYFTDRKKIFLWESILKIHIDLDPLKYLLASQYCFCSNIFLTEKEIFYSKCICTDIFDC